MAFDDEFNHDSAVNTSKWNGGGGGVPWCGNGDNIEGNQSCVQDYSRTTIMPGVGVALQPIQSIQESAGMNTYGKFSQKFGYFEFKAKMPTDANGEGDGYHPDLWFLPNGKTNWLLGCGNAGVQASELDEAEEDVGPDNLATMGTSFMDYVTCDNTSYPQPSSSHGDLSASFHTYALYWRNDGSGPYGSMQSYVDGIPQAKYTMDSRASLYGDPIYIMMTMDPCVEAPFFGGAACDSATSANDPLIVQYVRVWQSN
jgi:beta-glucanase (GH16 family)